MSSSFLKKSPFKPIGNRKDNLEEFSHSMDKNAVLGDSKKWSFTEVI